MSKDTRSFSQKHPKLNTLFGLMILIGLCYLAYLFLGWIINEIQSFIQFLKTVTTTLDAVIVVALITGAVSISGVIISSVISKVIDYRVGRRDYLAKKREVPYGEFVDMVYKVQQNAKTPGAYTESDMLSDLSKFSKQITLWGSPKVVNKWVEFRENSTKNGEQTLLLMEELMNEMRKDLGLKKVKKGNLLAFFVNDVRNLIKKR